MNSDIKNRDDLYIAHTYNRFPLNIVRGEGALVFDENNKSYIDFTSGIGVTCLGHHHKEWSEAVINQVNNLVHTSNLYYTNPCIDVAEKLCKKSGMKKVFFANSGAEANEGAIKVARKYANDKVDDDSEIITLVNSFHGRTITTLTATGQDVFHKNFGPFIQGFRYAQANDNDSLDAAINEHTIAIMIEIVQGEGGVIALDKAFTDHIQKVCNEKDILLIIDEVQSGIGRTGSLFAYEQYNLSPDIVSCAKGLGNGLPIGAILIGDKCEDVLHYGDHGTTFGGNPVVCAGSSIVLDKMNDEMYQEVKKKATLIKNRLLKMKHVKKVNGLGLMIGIELDGVEVKDIILKCINKGALFLSAKANLRMLPPLTISIDEINDGLDILEEVLGEN